MLYGKNHTDQVPHQDVAQVLLHLQRFPFQLIIQPSRILPGLILRNPQMVRKNGRSNCRSLDPL
jgi:hypothetical protein